VLRDEGLADRAAEMGELLRTRLRSIRSPAITAVRGRGLLNAIVVKPDGDKDASALCLGLMEAGLLAKPTQEHIIRLAPPLVISREQVEQAADIIESEVRALFG
jgi:ornithine--oxo-acid transaminase